MKKLTVKLEDGTEAVLTVDGMFIEGMHFDGLDEIRGVKEQRRASDVEFDGRAQIWCAVIRKEFRRTGIPFVFSDEKRSECIRWERMYLNAQFIPPPHIITEALAARCSALKTGLYDDIWHESECGSFDFNVWIDEEKDCVAVAIYNTKPNGNFRTTDTSEYYVVDPGAYTDGPEDYNGGK